MPVQTGQTRKRHPQTHQQQQPQPRRSGQSAFRRRRRAAPSLSRLVMKALASERQQLQPFPLTLAPTLVLTLALVLTLPQHWQQPERPKKELVWYEQTQHQHRQQPQNR